VLTAAFYHKLQHKLGLTITSTLLHALRIQKLLSVTYVTVVISQIMCSIPVQLVKGITNILYDYYIHL